MQAGDKNEVYDRITVLHAAERALIAVKMSNSNSVRKKMDKSVLVIDTPENCYDCPFGISYCGELEYEGLCELVKIVAIYWKQASFAWVQENA